MNTTLSNTPEGTNISDDFLGNLTDDSEVDTRDWQWISALMFRLLLWYGRLRISLAAITLFSTVFVLVIIAKEKSFHNISNYFVANLMMSDLFASASRLIGELSILKVSYATCGGALWYIAHVSYQVSCCTLILLTLTRYDAILNPIKSIDRWNGRHVLIASVLSWLVSFVVVIPSYFMPCNSDTWHALAIHIYIYCIMFLIPILILIFCYSHIIYHVLLNKFRRKQLAMAKRQITVRAAFQSKLTKMVVVILLVFFLLRAPRATYVLYKFLTGWATVHWPRARFLIVIFMLLEQVNGAIDPFIYALTMPKFREYLSTRMRCHCKKQSGPPTQQAPSVTSKPQ